MRKSIRDAIVAGLRSGTHVGLCSHDRASYLMGAAALAGGAIYVDLPSYQIDDDYDLDSLSGYPCHGTIGGEPVADIHVDADELIRRIEAMSVASERDTERCD